MESSKQADRYVPQAYLKEAEDVVFSLPEYSYEDKLEFLLKRIRENWDFDVEVETVEVALSRALETF